MNILKENNYYLVNLKTKHKLSKVRLVFLILLLNNVLWGQSEIQNYTGDSIRYLLPTDTLFITSSNYSEKIFEHCLAPKQTLYSLAKFYGMTVEDLLYYNHQIAHSRDYKAGDKIKIPIPNRAIKRYKNSSFVDSLHVPIFYIVKNGETLYHVAKRVFKLPVDIVKERNQLEDDILWIGQKLNVGWMSIEGIPDSLRKFHGNPLWKKSYTLSRTYNLQRHNKKEHRSSGPAFWVKGVKGNSDLFVMHKSAAVNSVIAVTNPMSKRTVYAKVVGMIPPAYPYNTEVVVSPAMAKLLGVKDEKFYVKVKYLN